MTPQLVIVGHIVKDVQSEGWSPGGGAFYAAAQAARLGIDAAVVTACEPDMHPERQVPDAEWHSTPLRESIRFENTYTTGRRVQRLLSRAAPLTLADIPEACLDAPSFLLAPVFHDIEPAVAQQLVKNGTNVAIGAQGWLRRLNGDRVRAGTIEAEPDWLHGDTVFLSEEDVDDPDAAEQWCGRVTTVVLTRGRAGCTVWNSGSRYDIEPIVAREEDPTGAGDVFASSYLVRYGETPDVVQSARFAAAAAAVAVEGTGIAAVGNRSQIEARLHAAEVTG